jgi:undecaprenyl-diphosphatase
MNPLQNVRANARAVARQFRSARRQAPLASWPSARIGAAFVLAATAILFAAIILDVRAITTAYELPRPVVEFGSFLSHVGRSVWFLLVSGLLSSLFFLADWRKVGTCLRLAWWEIGAVAGYAFIAFASAGILVNILKPIFGRARPRLILETGPFGFDFFSLGYSAASFPSGHSTDMGVFMVVASLFFPKLRVLFVALGIAFASSRVVVLAHYPSDVVAGLLLGATVAYLVARLYARAGYGLRVGEGGRIRTRTPALHRLRRRRGATARIARALPVALIGRAAPESRVARLSPPRAPPGDRP